MGYCLAGNLVSAATVVLDNQAVQKVAHQAPHTVVQSGCARLDQLTVGARRLCTLCTGQQVSCREVYGFKQGKTFRSDD